MITTLRAVRVAMLMSMALPAGAITPVTPQAAFGSGYCSVDAQKFAVKYAYAHQRTRKTTVGTKEVKETSVTVWLTDQALDTALLDKETADHFRAVMRQMGQAFIKGTPPVRFVRIELTLQGKAVNFDCSPKGEGVIGTSDAGHFEAKQIGSARVAGRFTTAGVANVSGAKFDVDVQFDLPISAEQ